MTDKGNDEADGFIPENLTDKSRTEPLRGGGWLEEEGIFNATNPNYDDWSEIFTVHSEKRQKHIEGKSIHIFKRTHLETRV
jgi:hypothetical protein